MSASMTECDALVLAGVEDLQNRAIREGLRVVLKIEEPEFKQANTAEALQALRAATRILRAALLGLEQRADRLETALVKPRD